MSWCEIDRCLSSIAARPLASHLHRSRAEPRVRETTHRLGGRCRRTYGLSPTSSPQQVFSRTVSRRRCLHDTRRPGPQPKDFSPRRACFHCVASRDFVSSTRGTTCLPCSSVIIRGAPDAARRTGGRQDVSAGQVAHGRRRRRPVPNRHLRSAPEPRHAKRHGSLPGADRRPVPS